MRRAGDKPSFEQYVGSLPGGLDAYPNAVAKGSLVRSALQDQPPEVLAALPEPLRRWTSEPPFDSEWVSETRLSALIHAIAELRGWDAGDCQEWTRQRNVALLTSPIYRSLMVTESPERMLRWIAMRWANFHRGSSLAFEGFADDGARLSLTFPSRVYDGTVLRAGGGAFAAALQVSNAEGAVVVEVERAGDGYARYRARW
jgi:hypothetical protein